MKLLLFGSALCSALMLFGLSAQAQDRFYGGRLFERTRADLDRVEDRTFPMTEDRHRLQRAKEQLNELQRMMDEHRHDSRQLNEVIETLQWVVNNNHLRRGDRDALTDDLARLREFRERHEEWRERR